MREIVRKRLEQLEQLNGRVILILGDVGVDQYTMGTVRRISPEAPVPVVEVAREEFHLGLASNVAQNVTGLKGTPLLVSVVGNDEMGKNHKRLCEDRNISTDYLVADSERPTTRKVRILGGGQQVVRVDYERRSFLSETIENSVIHQFQRALPHCDAVIVQDYGKGVVSDRLLQRVFALSKEMKKKTFVDPHRTTPLSAYRGCDYFKPNRDEALELSRTRIDDLRVHPDMIFEVGRVLLKVTEAQEVIITQGPSGMLLFNQKGDHRSVPTLERQVFDVAGAGDTVIATLALAKAAGLETAESALLANLAAGIVVGKLGSVPCSYEELRDLLAELPRKLEKFLET